MNSEAKNKEIAIYWDYENVALPKWCGAAEAAKQIYNAVSKYGRIVERRLYFDYQKHSANNNGPHDCSGLDLSGFDLVNTPTRNSKETLDKKLIADVLTFAWDCTARNTEQKPCVVLITSDGDYAYTLAKLRDRGVMNIVMYGKDCSVAQILVENADVSLSFERDVLSEQQTAVAANSSAAKTQPVTEDNQSRSALFFKNMPYLKDVREFVQFLERDCNALVQRALMFRVQDGLLTFAHILFTNANDGTRVLNLGQSEGIIFRRQNILPYFDTKIPTEHSMSKASSDCVYERLQSGQLSAWPRRAERYHPPAREPYRSAPAYNHPAQFNVIATQNDLTKICVCLYNEQVARTMAPLSRFQEYEKCWVPGSPFNGSVHHTYSSMPKIEVKGRIRSALDQLIADRYVTVARQKLESGGFLSVAWHKRRGERDDLSREAYFRLTLKGQTRVLELFHKKKCENWLGPRSQVNNGTDSADQVQTGSSSPQTINTGFNMLISNLPNDTNVRELVNFLDNSHHAKVLAAIIKPRLRYLENENEAMDITDSDNKSSAHVHLTDAKSGLAFIILSLTNGISFNGVQLKASLIADAADSFSDVISSCRESEGYLKQESSAEPPENIQAIPTVARKQYECVESLERDFCSIVFKEQKMRGNTELLPCDQCWIPYSSLGGIFGSLAAVSDLPTNDRKQLLKVTRDISIHYSLIEIGRKMISGNGGYVTVPWLDDGGASEHLSKEIFIRLTDAGVSLLFYNKRVPGNADHSCVFLQGLPWPLHTRDIVQFFEVECQATVQCISIIPDTNDLCKARIKFDNANDGSRILLAGSFIFLGAEVLASIDRLKALPMDSSDPMLFYTKSEVDADEIKLTEDSNSGAVLESSNDYMTQSDCTMNGTNTNSSHEQQITETQPEIEIDLPSECNFLVTNIDDEEEPDLDAAITAQDSEEAKVAEDLEDCSKHAVTMPTPRLMLQKELDNAVRAKDFARAASLQSQIEDLEQNACDGIDMIACMKERMSEEIDLAVETKNFARASSIQARIEGLENGLLTLAEAKTLLRDDLDRELSEAIKAKLFDKAGSIQTRIEDLEKSIQVSTQNKTD